MSIYNRASVIAEQLAERYDGPTYEREGQGGKTFTYIPWAVSVRLLDKIFGPFGWTGSQPQVTTSDGLVHVALAITVRVEDEDGNVIEKTVPGVGSAVARDDNSAKSAMSDAISKAVKYLGDAFGFFLSEKGGGKTSSNGGGSRSNGGDLGPRPSEKSKTGGPGQMAVLRKNGYTDEQVATMPFKVWKGILDDLFGGRTPSVAPAGKGQNAGNRRQDEGDDGDLPWN